MPRDEAILIDILNSGQLILDFVKGISKEDFLNDLKTQSSVLYQITIIGEAARKLSSGFQIKHSNIPWKLIMGMRNKLIHEYHDVDIDEVWKTIQKDVPLLLSQIDKIMGNL